MISHFRGQYFFLSNFFGYDSGQLFQWAGREFKTIEHIYRYEQVLSISDKELIIQAPDPKIAKKLAKEMAHRPEWDNIKLSMMKVIINEKFKNKDLKELLLSTGNEELVDKNMRNDDFWGKCTSSGKNHLGLILMQTREHIRNSD